MAYSYNIGTYEVTAGEYTAFLNAVAATDTFGLYNTDQAPGNAFDCRITRSGVSGGYSYSVDSAFVNRPVNYVSFWDSTRFANWMHNGQPTGPQSKSTTDNGAYTLTADGISGNTITRNAGWQWAVTSEDEWYKAAYYKGGNTNAGYWLYPASSNTPPGRDVNDPSGNNANLATIGSGGGPIQSPYYTTVGGEFQNSASPFGTFDQGGNVKEWNEAIMLGSFPARGIRGGGFSDSEFSPAADWRDFEFTRIESSNTGFRVVTIPGPSSVALLAIGGVMATRRRR